MTLGIQSAVANSMLNAAFRATAYTGPATIFVKLHLGDPGAAGTANPAVNTTRQAVTFAAASGGAVASNADVQWTSVAATETYTHFSLWTASSGGTFVGSGTVAGGAISVGQNFTLAAGDVSASLIVAA